MAVGLHTVNLANAWLNTLRGGAAGVTFTAPAVMAVKLHTADPGSAATTAASANTTRVAITFAAASGASMASSNTPSWASWASGSETLSHISVWDSTTAGIVYYTAALTTPKAVTNGDTFNLTSVTFALTPVMA